MKVRTRRKLLISSVAMLLVALLALGTATFAWFTSFTTVNTTDLTVNATGDSSLLIKGTEDSNFGQIGNSTLSANPTALHPATSWDGVNFGTLDGDVEVPIGGSAAATWTGTNGAFDSNDLVLLDETGGTFANYVAKTTYDLKNAGADAPVYVKNITSSTNTALQPSLRVAIQLGNNTTQVFNVGGGTNMTAGVGKYTSGNPGSWELASKTYNQVGSNATSLGTLTANVYQTATVYIWFEGQDSACMSDNISTTDINLQIYFTTDTPATTAPAGP